jgi:putative methionine-R-sulfoxide reductase with GAF domain
MGTVAGILLSSLPLTIGAAAFGIIALWRLDRSPSTNPAAGAECAVPVAQPVPVERIAPSLDPEVVLAALKGAAEQVAPVVATHLWLVDAPTGTLRQIAAWGLNAPTGQPTLLNSDDVLAQAVTTGRAEIGPLATIRAAGDATTVWRYALPIDAGEAEGVAGVDFSSAEQPDLSEMPKLMATMRASLSGALGLHVSKVELETARHLVEATRELSRILDPREVLVASLHRAMALSNAESGSIMLLDEHTGKLLIEVAEGLPAEVVHSTALAEGEGIAGWVLASRQPMLIEDLPARTPAARRHGIRSAASVPLMDDDGILGVLNVGSRSFPARFTDSHLASLGVLAKQTATALRNARAIAESRSLYFETLKALAIALETKDPYSRSEEGRGSAVRVRRKSNW